jgi:sterol desaturase/sphingolipid hydroxylase (fatty acid hydroxylase superfamily)
MHRPHASTTTTTMSLSAAWAHIVATHTPRFIDVSGGLLTQLLTFWTPSVFFFGINYLFPVFSARHKTQPVARQPSHAQTLTAAKTAAVNTFFVSLLQWSLLYPLGLPSSLRIVSALPSFREVAADFVIGLAVRELLFYYTHRLFHHPALYVRVHKRHNEFAAPVAFAAQHATFTEHVFANTLPVVVAHMTRHTHIVSFWCFMGWETLQSALDHSGFDFGVLWRQQQRHDRHHELFGGNYGSLGVLDWVHGTNKGRRAGQRLK